MHTLHDVYKEGLERNLPSRRFEDAITVTPRYNAVIGRHLLGPPYKRGALWDPVDLFDIIIIGSSSNVLIATLRENTFIHAGPLRQKWMRSVYTVYN